MIIVFFFFFFFFSSRRRHTRFDCDWSSDVCSSDLAPSRAAIRRALGGRSMSHQTVPPAAPARASNAYESRVEVRPIERRAAATTIPKTAPAVRIGTTPRKEKGCGPRRVIAAKAPSMRPVASVSSKPGRRIRYTRRYSRLGAARGRCRGGGGGRGAAPLAVGGHRGGGASRALASVSSWTSSVAVIAPSESTARDQPPQTPPRGGRQR